MVECPDLVSRRDKTNVSPSHDLIDVSKTMATLPMVTVIRLGSGVVV